MSTPNRFTDPAQARRILVTIAVAAAAIATVGLAANRHHPSSMVQRAEAALPTAAAAPTSNQRAVGTPSDSSVPTAAEAIERIEREAAESPPMF